jgi:6-bladed beta-propeller
MHPFVAGVEVRRATADHSMKLGWVGLVACASLAGCGGESGAQGSVAAFDTLANGTVVVRNSGEPALGDTPWTAVEELRIGVVEGPPELTFGDIAFIEVDDQGRIYVLDYQAQDIRVFDENGSFSYTIGGRGPGPGELIGAAGLAWAPNDVLVVWDTGGRYSFFRSDGEFLRSEIRHVTGVGFPWSGFVDPDGVLYDWGLDRPGFTSEPGWAGDLPNHWSLVAYRGDPWIPDTVRVENNPRQYHEGRAVPYGYRTTRTPDPAGFTWESNVREIRLAKKNPAGDTLLIIEMPASGPPVTQAMKDSIVAVQRERAARYPGSASTVIPHSVIPNTREIFTRIAVTREGAVWIFPELEDGPAGSEAMMFDANGVYQGRVQFPFRIVLATRPVIRGNQIWAEVHDELEVPFVVRARFGPTGS